MSTPSEMSSPSNPRSISGLQGRSILLGVTGSIAAYKAAEWVRALVKEEARVQVILTEAAQRFVPALTFAALAGTAVHRDLFLDDPGGLMAHITLSREADALLIAPASAQTIARLATGQADNLLCATALAARIPVLVCPAMNTAMYQHPATQDNMRRLRRFGYRVLQSGTGELACGEQGEGRLPDWDEVREALLALFTPADLRDTRVLITAGPTHEAIDPVRYLGNRSSGKMGFALARTAARRGAVVTLVSGPTALTDPPGVTVHRVQSARDMAACVLAEAPRNQVIVKAAAVADFTVATPAAHKIKKSAEGLHLQLVKNIDILAELGARKEAHQILVGFAAESRDHLREGERKLREKNLDLIVVNDILDEHSGFDTDTNQVFLIDRKGSRREPLLSKEATADRIWDAVRTLLAAPDSGQPA